MLAASEMEPEMTDRLSPLQKLISSDKLTFIPNLYFQQYRLLDMLADCRIDYPDQKILVPKQPSRHSYLQTQMKQNHFILEQDIKYRKAVCYNLAKNAKQEYFKKKLKKQQKYLFHRVAFSQLSESLKNKFQQNNKNGEREKQKENEKKQENKDNKKILKSRISDDIFIDKDQSDVNIGADEDLIGDLFGSNPRMEENVEKIEIPVVQTVEDYIMKVLSDESKGQQCQKQINRKTCLRKINQNIRKRIKSKLNQDTGQKNLNSATVLITSLISSQTQIKNGDMLNENNLIDPPAQTQFLSNVQTRQKKKKEDNFQLKWGKQDMEKYNQRNGKFQIGKAKFDSNYLTMNILKDDREYEKIFNKNITGKQPFPPSINSITPLSSKFTTESYINTPADPQYQQAIIQHNKRKKYEKFKKISEYALQKYEYTNADTQQQSPSTTSNNISKIFLNPDLTVSDRIIYQIHNNKIIPVNVVHNKSSLTKEELLLLNFLVRKYLCVFGSNWKIITTLILTHPNFSSMYLTTQQIQELYQIPRQKDNHAGINTSIQQLNVFNKKILPSSIFLNCSYQPMKPQLNMSTLKIQQPQTEDYPSTNTYKMTDQSEQHEQSPSINLLNYQNIIQEQLEQHQNPKQYVFSKTAKVYDDFTMNMKLPELHQNGGGLVQSVGKVIDQFQGKMETRLLEGKEIGKFNQCSDWVLDKVKNQIKFNTPIRKRKNITDKSSQLVKILHTLKQRIQNPPKSAQPGAARLPPSQAPRQLAKPPIAPTTVAPPPPTTPTQSQTMKKTLPKPKPEDKKEKTGQKEQKEPKQPKQQKQRKKKPGKDQKDADKDQDSK